MIAPSLTTTASAAPATTRRDRVYLCASGFIDVISDERGVVIVCSCGEMFRWAMT